MTDRPHPSINFDTSSSAPLPLTCDARQDSVIAASDWQMYSGMGGPAEYVLKPVVG
jgi:hypothetical protein